MSWGRALGDGFLVRVITFVLAATDFFFRMSFFMKPPQAAALSYRQAA